VDVEAEVIGVSDFKHEQIANVRGQRIVMNEVLVTHAIVVSRDEPVPITRTVVEVVLLEVRQDLGAGLSGELVDLRPKRRLRDFERLRKLPELLLGEVFHDDTTMSNRRAILPASGEHAKSLSDPAGTSTPRA